MIDGASISNVVDWNQIIGDLSQAYVDVETTRLTGSKPSEGVPQDADNPEQYGGQPPSFWGVDTKTALMVVGGGLALATVIMLVRK